MSLHIGLIGCGDWGRHILRDLVSLGAHVHVVARTDATCRRAVEQGAATGQTDEATLPASLDGYVVATPSATHASIVERLLPSGKPIFVEKPMTCDVASSRRIAEAGRGRVFVMDKWRYHPGIEALASVARSGEIGRILAVRSWRLGWGNPHEDVDAIWHLVPHDLSIAYHVLGYLPKVHAAWSPVPGRARGHLIGVLQDAEEGPVVTVEVATSDPVKLRSVVVVGTGGSAQLAAAYDDRISVVLGDPETSANRFERAVSNEMPLLAELKDFLEHLRGGPPPLSEAAEGLLVVERIAGLRELAGLP